MQNHYCAKFLLDDHLFNIEIKLQIEKLLSKDVCRLIEGFEEKLPTSLLIKKEDNILREIKKAKKLHEQFLPKNVNLSEELSFASFYKPAEQIGGDYFNIFKMNGEQIVIYVSDVSGHGIDGAMLNIYLKTTIDFLLKSWQEKGTELAPNKIVKQITKKFISDKFDGDYMICLFLAILDLNSYKLTYASAGFQTPMIVFTEDGFVEKKEIGGLPISTAIPLELYDIKNSQFFLREGKTVLLFTDGIIEEEREGKAFGVSKIEDIAKNAGQKTPETVKQEIVDAFNHFTKGKANTDDITILIVKRCR